MQWYYAIETQRYGPVSDEELARFVANGTITGDTLVWRAGMAQWTKWSVIAPTVSLPDVAADAPPPLMVPLEVSAGAGATSGDAGPELSADEFWARLQHNGFSTSVGGCLGRAWEAYKSRFWLAFGVSIVGSLIMGVAGSVPFVGLLAVVLISPQITAGIQWFFLKLIRGEGVKFEDLFAGFERYGTLALVGFLQVVVAVICVLPIALLAGGMAAMVSAQQQSGGSMAGIVALGGVGFVLVLVMIGLMLRFSLTHVIVMDHQISATDAMKLSWRIVGLRFWTMIGLMVMFFLLSIAGMLALLIGVLFVAPLGSAMFAQLYEDAKKSALGTPYRDL